MCWHRRPDYCSDLVRLPAPSPCSPDTFNYTPTPTTSAPTFLYTATDGINAASQRR
jgi:hypothetical protein